MKQLEPRRVVFSSRQAVEIHDQPSPDMDSDALFMDVFGLARHYSMTSKEAMFALYEAVGHVVSRGVEGDFVECGVWRGGSTLLAAKTFEALGQPRPCWLYDTFEGMTQPTAEDVDVEGSRAADLMDQYGDDGRWCCAEVGEVTAMLNDHGLGGSMLHVIKGDVLETLRDPLPQSISILRLDTDWYESTLRELEVLYDRLSPGGILIVDDYGHWKGARKAVDEYFSTRPKPFMQRVNYTVRMAVKY